MLEVRQVDEDPGVELLELELDLAVSERVVAVLAHALRPAVEVLEPVRVGLSLGVLQHLVAGNVCRVPGAVIPYFISNPYLVALLNILLTFLELLRRVPKIE